MKTVTISLVYAVALLPQSVFAAVLPVREVTSARPCQFSLEGEVIGVGSIMAIGAMTNAKQHGLGTPSGGQIASLLISALLTLGLWLFRK